MKKMLSILLAAMLILAVSATAFAEGGITKEKAQEIALKDAGYAASEVVRIKAKFDNDDRVDVWDVDFTVKENGLYKDYDYEIKASDGTILEKSWEYEDDYVFVGDFSFFPEFKDFIRALIAWLETFLA